MNSQYEIEYLQAKNGEETIRVNNYYLHSKYNPSKEADHFAEQYFKPDCVQLIFGYGLGYFVRAIQDRLGRNEKIIVIDPIFNERISCQGISLITIGNDKDKLQQQLEQQLKITDNINVIVSPNYDKLLSEEYRNLLSELNKKLQMDQVTINTYKGFQHMWHKNFICNIEHALKDSSAVKLKNMYSCPIVIASGGPSLTKQLELLKRIRKKIILITAGSTINTLLAEGIEPDYVVSIDGSIENYGHFKELKLNKSKLIYSMTNHSDIRDSFNSDSYFFVNSNNSDMLNYLNDITAKESISVRGGGSVATFAFSIALSMTTGPIALIGQDLAYTNNKTHAENNKYLKFVDDDFKKNRNVFETKGYYGDSVLTDYPFLMMKESFETIYNSIGENRPIFNCTEGGALIKGMKNLPFIKFCNEYVSDNVRVINELKSMGELENSIVVDTAISKLNEEREVYKKILRLLEESLKLLSRNKSDEHFTAKTLKGLDSNDKQLESLINKTSIRIATKSINLEVLKFFKAKKGESSKDAFQRVFAQSETLYRKILLVVNEAEKYIGELIQKLQEEQEKKL